MKKPITNFDDFVEIYFKSGSARLRFKKGVTFELFSDEKIDKQTQVTCQEKLPNLSHLHLVKNIIYG